MKTLFSLICVMFFSVYSFGADKITILQKPAESGEPDKTLMSVDFGNKDIVVSCDSSDQDSFGEIDKIDKLKNSTLLDVHVLESSIKFKYSTVDKNKKYIKTIVVPISSGCSIHSSED